MTRPKRPTKAEAIRRKMAKRPKPARTLTPADMDALGQLFRAELAQMLTPSRPVILTTMRRGGCT